MKSLFEVVKNGFQAYFKLLLAQNLQDIEENIHNIDSCILYKRCCVIANSKQKSICDYYFNLSIKKYNTNIFNSYLLSNITVSFYNQLCSSVCLVYMPM